MKITLIDPPKVDGEIQKLVKILRIVFDDYDLEIVKEAPIAKKLLQRGNKELLTSVLEKVDSLLNLSKTDDPEFVCDDARKQALIGIRENVMHMLNTPLWVYCDYADDLYYALMHIANGSDWSTQGLKNANETLKRWYSEGETK